MAIMALENWHASRSARLRELEDRCESLAKFKAYVHRRLDEAGVPTDPDSPHKAEGCRIGGRLDIALNLANRAKELEDAMRWIPTGERMPSPGSKVLVGHPDFSVCEAKWMGSEWDHDNWNSPAPFDSFTHWRPLPAPPAPADEQEKPR